MSRPQRFLLWGLVQRVPDGPDKITLVRLMARLAPQHGVESGRLGFFVPENGLDRHQERTLI